MKKQIISFLMSAVMILSLISPNLQVFAKENSGDSGQMQSEISEISEAEITTEATEEATTEEADEEITTGISTEEATTEEPSTEETSSGEESSTENTSTDEEATTEESIVFYMDSYALESYNSIGAEADGIMTYAASNIDAGYSDYSAYLEKHTILVDGAEYNHTDLLDPAESFVQYLQFKLERADMKAYGLKYYFEFPENISIGNVGSESSQITLYNTKGLPIGTYFIKNDVLYVSFPGYYDDVTAYFSLKANWTGINNKSNITVKWPKDLETVKFDLSDINISKGISSFEMDDEGNRYAVFSVRISPKSEDLAINGVTFEDTYTSQKILISPDYFKGSDGKYHDISIKTYSADGSLKGTSYYEYDDVAVTTGSTTRMKIDNLSVPANGYIMVQYAVEIDSNTAMKMEANNQQASYNNVAKASYDLYDENGNKSDTVSSTAERKGEYGTSTGWVYKEVGDGVYTDDKTELIVPYTVGINRDRFYSLGGSIVQDEITQYDEDWTVRYNLETTPYITITDEDGARERNLEWKVLDDTLYQELKSVLYKGSQKTAMENLLNGTGSYATLRNKLKTALGVSSLTNEIVSTYMFTDSNVEDFIWIMPLDTMPTYYMLHYDTIVPSQCDGNSNSASMWYTEYEAVPPGPGTGYTNPYKKVLEIDKSNDGVYEDGKGNYLVDWHISLTVPAGSHFDHIQLNDRLQTYNIPGEILGTKSYLTVRDWFYDMNGENFSLEKVSPKGISRTTDTAFWNNVGAYEWGISDKIFSVSSTSSDPNVQNVVSNLKGVFGPYAYYSAANPDYNMIGSINCRYNNKSVYTATYMLDDTTLYSGENFDAGQFVGDWIYSNRGDVRAAGDYSWTPSNIIYYIEELPESSETYTITIDYTMQVNPMLVKYLPEILETSNLDYITLKNTVTAYQGVSTTGTYVQDYSYNFGYSGVGYMISSASSSYYIGKQDIDANIFKDVISYNENTKTVDYKININPYNDIATTHTTYELEDIISYSGITYKEDTLVLKDGAGSVMWTTNPKVAVASKYKSYADKISLKLQNKDNGSSTYSLIFDNTTGLFDGNDGKLLHMILTYSVDAKDWATDAELENTVNLMMEQDVQDTDKTAKIVVGSATSSFTYDVALDKTMTKEPMEDNAYSSSFEVLVNLESAHAAELLLLNPGDTFTIKDTLSENLSLDIDSIQVVYLDSKTEQYVPMDVDNYSIRFDKDINSLYAKITVMQNVKKYKLMYDASVVADAGHMASFSNTASILDTSVDSDVIADKVYIQEYNDGADATTYKIGFVKYDGDNLNKRLGAAFNLYYWNTTSKSWVKLAQDSGELFETDSETGILELSNALCSSTAEQLITKDTWYKLVEVDSPNNYILDSIPIYYYATDTGVAGEVPKDSGITDYTVITVGQDEIYKIFIPNEKLSFKLQKVDAADSSIVLTGAEFGVYSDEACTKLVQTLTADENNIYRASDLDIGAGDISYYLKETKAPEEYKLDERVYEVKVVDSVLVSIKSTDGTKTLELDDAGVAYLFGNESIYGKLKVTKQITAYSNTNISKHANESFPFSIAFTDEDGNELRDTDGNDMAFSYQLTDSSGEITTGNYYSGDVIYLKHGEALLFDKLPEGIKYSIIETSVINYTTKVSVTDTAQTDTKSLATKNTASGSIEAGEQDTVSYENALKATLVVRKNIVSEVGLTIPDGFTIVVYDYGRTTIYAKGVYNAATDTFECTEKAGNVLFTPSGKGFTLTGLPSGVYFRIVEENADIDNYEYTVKATNGTVQTDNSIRTLSTISSGSTSTVTITNTYTTCTDVNLEARKTLSGRDLITGEFTFGLYDEDDNLVEQVNNAQYGMIKFKTLKFTEEGTFNYTIKEIPPQGATKNTDGTYSYKGITYTDDIIDVKIVTSYDKNNELVADVTYSIDGAEGNTLANTYEASGSLVLGADKSLVNLNLTANKFSFQLKEGSTVKSTAKNTVAGKVTFAELKYDLQDVGKTFTYTISEVIPAGAVNNGDGTYTLEHFTYDASVYTVTVKPVDNKDGTLSFNVTGASLDGASWLVDYDDEKAAAFVNEYHTETTTSFAMTKRLDNHSMAADQFTFTATEYTDSKFTTVKKNDGGTNITYKGKSVAGTSGKATGIKFEDVTYTIADAGTHYYQITEDVPSGATKNTNGTYTYKGVTYSVLKATATVTVSYNKTTGVLSTATSYGSTGTAFVNTYNATGKATLTGTKVLNGRDIVDGEFTFSVKDTAGKTVSTGSSDENGVITFTDIEYDEQDIGKTYTYTVTEDKKAAAGITYSDEKYTVKVSIADNHDGTLDVSVLYDGAATSNIAFTNKYEASVDVIFHAGKVLINKQLVDKQFNFQILDEQNKVVATATNDAEGNIVFSKLTYYIDGTDNNMGSHNYKVVEVNDGAEGYTYDDTTYEITVVAADNGDGTIGIKVTGGTLVTSSSGTSVSAGNKEKSYVIDYDDEKAGAFVNEYYTETTTSFVMTKRLNNHSMAADQFIFTATEYMDSKFTTVKKGENGTAITYKGKSILAAKDKAVKIDFDDITYTIADVGTHYYQIVEDIPSGATKNANGTYTYKGVTYSALKATATVKVSYNNVTGVLSTTTSYGSTGTAFVNTYNATGKATLTGTKVLNGRDIVDGEFTFSVKDTAGKTVSTGSSDENGVITFTDIKYDEQDIGKTYTYTVTEDKKDAEGVTYSDEKYTVKVSIADNHDGTLDVTVLYAGNTASNIIFTNNYETSVDVIFNAGKSLDSKLLADKQFNFQMLDEKDKVVATATNDAEGNIVFSKLTYYIDGTDDNMGDHNYRVVEVNDGASGYTYDDTVYEIVVAATNKRDGTIGIDVTGGSLVTSEDGLLTYQLNCEEGREYNFDNKYEATGAITFAGMKELIGLTTQNTREIIEGEFSFTITEYTDDTYTEVVKKPAADVNTDTGADTDTNADTGADPDADANADTGADADTDANADMGADADTEVSEEPEYVAVAYTCENDAEGNILYPEITYNRNADIDDVGTHYYQISENKGTAGGVTYSEEVYYVTVEVSDNDDGTLKVEGSENCTKLDFTNHYEASGSITFDLTKQTVDKNGVIYNDLDEDGESFGSLFQFEAYEILADGSEQLVSSVATGANGKTSFDEIVYDLDDVGTHNYRIVEVSGELGGYTYDSTEYKIAVIVSDNGDGTLKVETLDSEGNVLAEAGNSIRYGVSFKNTYDASGSITFEGSKTVENLDKMIKNNVLKKGEFTFTVIEKVDNKDVVAATGKNDAEGNILFTQIDYDWEDIGAHIYTIVEDTNNRVSNIVYDDEPVTVIVQVSNEGNGTLGVEVQYIKSETGERPSTSQESDKAEFTNASTETKISKVDEDGNPVKDAKLGIYNENGKLVVSITSTEEMQVVYGLDTGVKYTLRETEAPKGYKTAADISFKLDEEGSLIVNGNKVEYITMVDERLTATGTNTGDNSNSSAAMMLLLISVFGMGILMLYKKKYMTD